MNLRTFGWILPRLAVLELRRQVAAAEGIRWTSSVEGASRRELGRWRTYRVLELGRRLQWLLARG